MAWLARNCNVIAPEDFRERAESGVATSKPNVMVTFDDGYRDYFDHAYPVLQRHRIRAMNFLCTRFVDEPALIGWWDRLYLAVRATRKPSVTPPWDATTTYELNPGGRAAFLAAAKDYVKRQPELEKDATTALILEALDVDGSALHAPRQTMSWDEVRKASDFTVYGGHTHNHVIVSRLDGQPLDDEIRTCRERIERETGNRVETFAYPNGRAIDFTDEAKRLLRRHGFRTAFTTIDGINSADTDWLAAPRIAGGSSVGDLAWRLARLQ